MSTNEDTAVLKYAELFYDWYVGKMLLAGRVLSVLCSDVDLDKLDRDWLLERRAIIITLYGNINRYGSMTR
jgi:hypothetical protein